MLFLHSADFEWYYSVGLWKSQSFRLILRSLPIPIKILKKDLDPGSLDPLVRSSNSLNLQHCASLALQAFLKFPQAQRWCMLGKHGSPWNGHHNHPEQPLLIQLFQKFIWGSPWSCPTTFGAGLHPDGPGCLETPLNGHYNHTWEGPHFRIYEKWQKSAIFLSVKRRFLV